MGDLRDRSLRPSFRSAIRRAERQVEYDALITRSELPSALIHEVCKIIAEVYMMDPDKPIRVSGEWLDGHVVQEVFLELTSEHVATVIEEYLRVCDEIRNAKAYIRTALYNSVFTIDAQIENRLNQIRRG